MNSLKDTIRILHVDDDPDFAELAATFVERQDDAFSVEYTTSPAEGLERLNNTTFDCVVSDYDMPRRNGIEFLELVREKYPDLPFILYTGKGSEEVASDAISAGVTDYLQKANGTSQYTVLANRIRNAVNRHRTKVELKDREKRLNLFFEQSPIGVIEWDDEFNFKRLNETAEEILGYTQADLQGQSWEMIVPDTDRGAVGDVVSDLLRDEGGYKSINENRTKDGEQIVCAWYNRVVTDEAGDVVAVFSQFQDITERRRQQHETSRRRHRLEQILKTVPACVVQLNTDGEFVFANDRAKEVLGLERDELTDRAYNDPEWDIRDLDGQPMADEELPFRQVLQTGDTVSGVRHTVQWPDGTQKLLEVNGAPVFDDDGEVESVVFSLSNITDKLEQGEELDRTQRRLELAMEGTDTGVFEWNIQTDEVYWSDSLERLLGLDPGEFEETFEAFADRVHPDDLSSIQKEIETAIETESMYHDQFRMLNADETYQWVEVRGRILQSQDGDQMIGIHQDISEEKAREETLDRQRSLLKAQQEALIDGLLVVNESNEIVSYNNRFIELWGIPEALIEQGDEDPPLDLALEKLAHPEEFQQKLEHLYENPEETARDEIELADGRVFDRYTAPVIGNNGTHYGRLWMFRDITEQKAREQRLTTQNERLDEFASVMSHDLRNPLRTAQGHLELVIEESDSSSHLDAIANAHDRMESIIEGLLTLAREGQDIGTTECVDLPEVINETWLVTGADVETVALSVESELTTAPRHIEADAAQLKRLFENLFRNSIDHSDEHVTVTVGRLDHGFYVADDGPGIPEEDRDTVFDVGQSSTAEGTGFGLSIVRQVAEGHGWTVQATDSSTGDVQFDITGVEFVE
mgnify:CR=1 FL=1